MQVNQEKRNQFKTNYELVKTGITKGYEENISLESIAKSLNQLGLKTVGGLDWTSSSVCVFAIKELGLRRTKEHKSFTKKSKTNEQTTEQINDTSRTLEIEPNDIPEVEQEQKETSLVKIKPVEFKTVLFNGVELLAIKGSDNKLYSPIKKFCDQLGVESSSQIRRIKRNEIFNSGNALLALPSPSGIQEYFCLNIDFLPFWLSGITTNLCKEEIRPMLLEFQLKAKDVLAQAFIKKEPPKEEPKQPESNFEILERFFGALKEQKQEMNQIKQELKAEIKNEVQQSLSTSQYALEQVLQIKNTTQEAIKELESFEYPEKIYDIPLTKKLNALVKNFVVAKYEGKATGEDFKNEWNYLYRQVYQRLGKDLKTQASNKSKKTGRKYNGLHIAIDLNILYDVYQIALSLFNITQFKKVG